MGKLPILFPQESLKIWKTKIGKLTIRGVPCPWGSPESPLDKAPGFEVWRRWLRYGVGAAPNLSSFSPADVCTKEHLGKKNWLRKRNQLLDFSENTHMKSLWWQFGRLLKIWIVDVDYWMSFADLFILLFFGLKPNCQTWDFFQSTLNGLYWAKKRSDQLWHLCHGNPW